MNYDDLKDRINDTKKDLDLVKEELNVVKDEVSSVQQDTALIKLHVTNHLPHLIAEIKDGLDSIQTDLTKRIADVETKNLKFQGVKEFLTGLVKVCLALATVTWTIIQIVRVWH